MADSDPATVSFPRDKTMIVVWLVVFGAAGLFGLILPVGFALTGGADYGLQPVMNALGGVLVLACLSVVSLLVRAWRDPSDPIVVSPEGLRVLAVSPRIIMWNDIAEVRRSDGRARGVSFELTPAARQRVPLRLRARLHRPINLAFGLPGYDIPLIDSTARLDQLVAAIARYKKVEGID